MPLTPVDIHNMAFKKSSLGRRGYDEEDVDSLLDAVAQQMIQLLEENDLLRDRARRADAVLARETTPDRAADAALSAVSEELHRSRRGCERAEQAARTLRSQLEEARHAAAGAAAAPPGAGTDRVVAMAHRTAEQHVRTADLQADELLVEARARSEQVTRQARQAAQDIAEDARRRDDDAAAELQSRHLTLTREVDALAGFARDYRAALEGHVRRQGEL